METITVPTTSPVLFISRPGATPPKHLSYSALSDYEFCPMSYALRRVDRSPRQSNISTFVGMAVHEIMEKAPEGVDPASMIAAVAATYVADKSNAKDTVQAEDKDEFVNQVAETIKKFTDWDLAHPHRKTLKSAEVQIDGTISDRYLVGKIDALDVIDDLIVLTDYKSGKVPTPVVAASEFGLDGPTEAIYHSSVTRQLFIYALLARSKGLRVDRVRLLYTKNQTVIEVDVHSPRGEVLMREAENAVDYQASGLELSFSTGRFYAKPTKGKCASCSVQDSCPGRWVPEDDD